MKQELSMKQLRINAALAKGPRNKGALKQRNAFEHGKLSASRGIPLKFSKTLHRTVRAAFRKGWHTQMRAQS